MIDLTRNHWKTSISNWGITCWQKKGSVKEHY